MEKIKKEFIFNKRGELCDKLMEYFQRDCDKEFIPRLTDQGYRIDWRIIGLEFEKYFGWNLPIKPDNLLFKEWQKAIPQVRRWVVWISLNVFYPSKMLLRTHATDFIFLRIASAMLNNIELSRYYKDIMFDNMIFCYYSRKRVYLNYYYQQILGIPF